MSKTELPLDPAMLDMLIATNQYGTGPGYMQSDENPYTRVGQRLNFLQDVQRYGGFYLDDLLGIGPEPERPDGDMPQMPQMPQVFQSDIPAMYGSNPVYSEMINLINQGEDPRVAAQMVSKAVEAGEFGEGAEMFLPQPEQGYYGQADPASVVDQLAQVGLEYKGEVARGSRETAQQMPEYQRALQDYERQMQQRQQQEADWYAYNNPMSEWELLGSKAPEEDYSSLMDYVGQVGAKKASYVPTGEPTGTTGAPGAVADVIRRVGDVADVAGSWGGAPRDSGAAGSATARHSVRMAQKADGMGNDSGGSRLQWKAFEPTEETQKYLQGYTERRQQRQQQNIRPSGREQDNRRRLQAAYQMLFGENL